MTNKMLHIVSVSEDCKLAIVEGRKVLRLEYSENTINILKQYLEQVYQHDFDKQPYFRLFSSTIYNISNHIKESFYFRPSHSAFNKIEIEDDYLT